MKKLTLIACIVLLFISAMPIYLHAQTISEKNTSIDKVQALKDTLNEMWKRSTNDLFTNHCESFLNVIDAQTELTTNDNNLLSATYDAFCSTGEGDIRDLDSYLNRQRSFVIAWQSTTDYNISFATLKLPKDWDPETAYPVYIQLHGLWNVADSPIDYMTYSFRNGPSTTYAYEDGYMLNPWGRGNFWYEGISETDIWECKAELERLVKIDLTRQYITGHSMGGYGAWYIASRSAETWAGLGIYAGALWYDDEKLLEDEVIQQLKDMPTYFVCGTNDGLLDVDQRAYDLLNQAGNMNTKFVTFEGGHEFLSANAENMYMWLKDFTNEDITDINAPFALNAKILDCFPNPFSSSTNIQFNLENIGFVTLSIYNSEGRLIENLINKYLPMGFYSEKYSPSPSIPGLYLCVIKIDGKQYQQKMIVVR
jgi:dienelactone hydrolase